MPAAPERISAIPSHLVDRVSIGAAPSWIVERTLGCDTQRDGGSNPILLSDRQFHAERKERYERQVMRLDTARAVHEAGQWRLHFDPATDRLTIHSLLVRRGERAAENAGLDRLRILQREENLEYGSLDGDFTVLVLLEDIRTGDVVDVSYSLKSARRIFPDHFSAMVSIFTARPIRDFHLRVQFSAGRPLRWKSNDTKLVPKVREEAGELEWSWQVNNLPGSEPEANVPTWQFTARWIQISQFASWAEVVAGVIAAWPEDLQNPEVLDLVKSITASSGTAAGRATQALTFLQDEIRYLSVNTEFGGQIPASPGTVIKRGFGDCKDKAFAAAHLLRLLGIPARPVLVNTAWQQSVQEFLPELGVFDHAIVEYEIDGRRRWVDVTVAHQGGSALSRPNAQFHLGLPIGPGVVDLEAMATDESADRLELQETFRINTRGGASSLAVVVTATGREAEKWRFSLTHDGLEAFSRARERFYQQIYPGTQRLGKLEWRDDREGNELMIAETFDLHDIAFPIRGRNSFLFRLSAHSIHAVLGFYESGKRRNPWAMRFPCRLKHTIDIDSSGLPQNLSRSAQIAGDVFRFTCHSQQRPGFASITYLLQILSDHVPVEDFESFKAKVREVWPLTSVVGELPAGSVVPAKSRTADALLPRRNSRAPASPGRPDEEYANSADTALGEAAPALSSRESREKTALAPRRENSTRPMVRTAPQERRTVVRPNPIVPNGAPNGETDSRRTRSERRKKRQRENLLLLLGTIGGAAILIGMIVYLVHAK